MRIAILTTDTVHHAYFVREMAKHFPPAVVVLERKAHKPHFETGHPFESLRDAYETGVFFGGKAPAIESLAPTHSFASINESGVLSLLSGVAPEVIIVFGTGKIGRELIGLRPQAILNLHGGDPREYRGLDSHLWAIYHGDFGGLVTTLHHLNPELDDGDIILQGSLRVEKGMELHQLRRSNAEVCARLGLSALDMFARNGGFTSVPQRKHGRYYSFMPAPLKEICLRKFKAHTERLPDGSP